MKQSLSRRGSWGIGEFAMMLVLAGVLAGMPVIAQDNQSLLVNTSESIILPAENVDKVAIADPSIANVVVLSDKELSVIGIKSGVTTLTIVHKDVQPAQATKQYRIEVSNIAAASSFKATEAAIHQMTGQPNISVKNLGDTLVIDGQVEDEIQMQRAASVAGASSAKVLNLIEVKNPRQIKVHIRVVEVSSEAVKRLGIKYFGQLGDVTYGFGRVSIFEGPNAGQSFSGGTFVSPTGGDSAISPGSTPVAITATLSLLAQQGKAKTLSEPTLITFSGKEASFLVGEEYPITQQLQNTFTVEYKEIGVRMKVKPTADSQNRVNTVIHAEVSQIRSFVGEQQLPVISTKKADTTLQVNDGQTIVLSGLLDNNNSLDILRKVPWLGDIPLFGYLFRHKSNEHTQREVVFFMTPEIVKNIDAVVAGAIKTPLLKEWNGNANENVLDIPQKDWADEYEERLHNHLATPATEKPAPPASLNEPNTNVVPARPVGK